MEARDLAAETGILGLERVCRFSGDPHPRYFVRISFHGGYGRSILQGFDSTGVAGAVSCTLPALRDEARSYVSDAARVDFSDFGTCARLATLDASCGPFSAACGPNLIRASLNEGTIKAPTNQWLLTSIRTHNYKCERRPASFERNSPNIAKRMRDSSPAKRIQNDDWRRGGH
jgi:hypothetical protein